jgi:hypothetical protein
MLSGEDGCYAARIAAEAYGLPYDIVLDHATRANEACHEARRKLQRTDTRELM